MEHISNIPIVSSEISGIWNSYVGENIFASLLKHFSSRVDDSDIHSILQYALDMSNQRINTLTAICKQEKILIPTGLTDNDVDLSAPRLFTDTLYLQYVAYASRISMHNYSYILGCIARSDIRDYFSKCILESVDLYNKTAELSLSKGLFIRSPRVETTHETEFIKSKSFMTDWFGKKRSLTADEITHVFSIISDTSIRRALVVGFQQTCKDKKISDYLSKVLTLSAEQNNGFISILTNNDIPVPGSSDSYVTDSTVPPFSDKLILTKLLFMYKIKIGSLGMALPEISRSDLRDIFMKYLDESAKYAQDAASILIDYGWLEQPPQAIDHKNLTEV